LRIYPHILFNLRVYRTFSIYGAYRNISIRGFPADYLSFAT